MQYRQFGKLDFHSSALGFGCMRLPTLGDASQIDEPEAIKMIRYAIDNGVNYFDTAYPYHGGNSERLLGKALRDGYRQRVKVADKLPVWEVKKYADFDRLLGVQLERLQVDQIDFYLLHGLDRGRWRLVRDLGVTEWAEAARAKGWIGHFGFSFHDSFEVFKEIVDGYDGWDMCQLQYNYLDEEVQAGTRGVRYAAARGLAVVVMEPLLGGRLASPPLEIQALWDRALQKRSAAEWGLQWVWNHPEVSVVLSGMSTMDQVVENVASANRSAPNSLTAEDLKLFAAVREMYVSLYPVPCTQCRYCMPCPNDVDIPANMLSLNRGVATRQMGASYSWYAWSDQGRAKYCIQCRECEEKCPQGIPIGDWMPYIDRVLGGKLEHDYAAAPPARRSSR